ncbi:hypothetical protein BCON_0161g00180 [Botryotinia convoluta]|uniref:Uncharacterized protein n=1 Tax=Botryotinia convoluta TaxID=54673 RepID=A0A4Z1HRI2_9HELO|nr:hypothetical protein BCON_0161g00180 [Botryotinia convoluta]
MDMDKSLEEYRDAMMKAFKEPLSHRDISDIWDNLQERPTELCGAGKSPITWGEVWKSLVDVCGSDCLEEAVTAATKACEKGGHAPKRYSKHKILVPPQYCEQYVGLTTLQCRMFSTANSPIVILKMKDPSYYEDGGVAPGTLEVVPM